MKGNGIIFDFDGTLADTLPDIADSVNAGLIALGLAARPYAEVRDWIGEGLPLLCRRAIRDADGVDLDEMVRVVTGHYRENRLNKVRPFDGVAALLDALVERNVPIAVLTNKPHEHTTPMMDALFSDWPFAAIEGYREESRRKPDPRAALEIVGRMGLSPGEVLMVGDSFTDMQTGVNAGLVPIGCTWGYRSRAELLDAGAHALIDHPGELLTHVR